MKKNMHIMSIVVFLVFQFLLDACGSDSGNDASESTTSSVNLMYNTLEGLNAEMPCNEFLKDSVAYVKFEKTSYICMFNSDSMVWKWNVTQNSSSQDSVDNGNILGPSNGSPKGNETISTKSSSVVDVFATYDDLLAERPCDEKSFGYAYVSSLKQYYICTWNDYEIVVDVNTFEDCKWFSCDEHEQISLDNGMRSSCSFDLKRISAIQDYVANNTNVSSSSVSKETALCNQTPYFPDSQFCDMRDGQIYKYTNIALENANYFGVWMAENLRYPVSGSSCAEDEMLDGCLKYGRYYTWITAVGGNPKVGHDGGEKIQGICPLGWHIPSYNEWKNLSEAVQLQLAESKQNYEVTLGVGDFLKSRTGWNEYGGTDAFGFSALPAGLQYASSGNIFNKGRNAYFWSRTYGDYTQNKVYAYGVGEFGGLREENTNVYALSVRCVRDY